MASDVSHRILSRRSDPDERHRRDYQALWDIKGKVLNAPVWQLMGGLVRDKIKAYSWVGGDRRRDVIDGIKTLREIGFDTFKLNGCEELGLIDHFHAVVRRLTPWHKLVKLLAMRLVGLGFHGRVSARWRSAD
ncbi:hypothetical protein ACNKHV_23460 [Shigella flexneri]